MALKACLWYRLAWTAFLSIHRVSPYPLFNAELVALTDCTGPPKPSFNCAAEAARYLGNECRLLV
jgi:hypothetical protein